MSASTLSPALHAFARRLVRAVLLCGLIALFLTLVLRDPLWRNLVYSMSIGLSCHAFIEASLVGLARWQQRHLPAAERSGWPSGPATVACVVLGAAAGVALGTTIADALTGLRSARLLAGDHRALTVVLAISLVASAAATAWFHSREKLRRTETQAQAAQRAAAEAQLRLLESQLEPHMLFNTLANLRALIGIDPPRAQAMLDRLIAYLRATLSASRAATHPLASEFQRLDDYLALMALRMGPRLRVRLDLPEALRTHPVPPLLLQPLVENAIRHGLEPHVAGGRLEVSARRVDDRLVLQVRDTGAGLGRGVPGGTGFGTVQVRERLRALHGDAAGLTLAAAADAEGGTLATVTLPWSPAA